MPAQWRLTDWNEPDLDRGIITHKTLTNADVKLHVTKETLRRLVRAADKFADDADKDGIAVTAEEWLIGGCDDT